MQDMINNPTVMKNLSYGASGGLSLFGVLSLQHVAIIIGIIFTILTWWVSYRATAARRKEEQDRHRIEHERSQLELEFAKARERREQHLYQLAMLQGKTPPGDLKGN